MRLVLYSQQGLCHGIWLVLYSQQGLRHGSASFSKVTALASLRAKWIFRELKKKIDYLFGEKINFKKWSLEKKKIAAFFPGTKVFPGDKKWCRNTEVQVFWFFFLSFFKAAINQVKDWLVQYGWQTASFHLMESCSVLGPLFCPIDPTGVTLGPQRVACFASRHRVLGWDPSHLGSLPSSEKPLSLPCTLIPTFAQKGIMDLFSFIRHMETYRGNTLRKSI